MVTVAFGNVMEKSVFEMAPFRLRLRVNDRLGLGVVSSMMLNTGRVACVKMLNSGRNDPLKSISKSRDPANNTKY